MNKAELNELAGILANKLRPIIRSELKKMVDEKADLDSDIIFIDDISKILGHCKSWCRRKENQLFPHFYVSRKLASRRSTLTRWAIQNGISQ